MPHEMSEPLETAPSPNPAFDTVSVTAGSAAKLASTLVLALIVNVQVVAVPVHAPVHEPNDETAFGCAVSVMLVPGAYE